MIDWLTNDLTSMAFIWRLERSDGVALGLTSHDHDLVIDNFTYHSAPGMVPSTVERTSGFDPDTVDVAGALTTNAIREADLMCGRWDGARLRLSAVDWSDPDSEIVHLVRGELGQVETSSGHFSVSLRGPTSVFDAPVVETTSPDCRASLGDKRCGVDMASRVSILSVISANRNDLIVSGGPANGTLINGCIRWIDGANAGLNSVIFANTTSTITLVEPPFFPVEVGARILAAQGCDRRFATCVERFANAINFRGEPHLPGNDLLTRYAV